MAQWHGYILVSEVGVGWTGAQRPVVRQALRALGPSSADRPAYLAHTRQNLAGTALIIEARFDADAIQRDNLLAMLGAATGLTVREVAARVDVRVFAPGGSWEDSAQAARAFIASQRAQWEQGGDPGGSDELANS